MLVVMHKNTVIIKSYITYSYFVPLCYNILLITYDAYCKIYASIIFVSSLRKPRRIWKDA